LKKLQKMFYSLASAMLLLSITVLPIEAKSSIGNTAIVFEKDNDTIIINADVIIEVFRVLWSPTYPNGVLQVRRWNETRGYWVDPDWTNIY